MCEIVDRSLQRGVVAARETGVLDVHAVDPVAGFHPHATPGYEQACEETHHGNHREEEHSPTARILLDLQRGESLHWLLFLCDLPCDGPPAIREVSRVTGSEFQRVGAAVAARLLVESAHVERVDGARRAVVDAEVTAEDVEGEHGIDDVGVDGRERT